METKYIIVKGTAGLGNRLITLAAAIDYALRNNRKILIDWSDVFLFLNERMLFINISRLKIPLY